MKRAWIGMALLSGSWLFGLSYYYPAQWLWWTVMVTAGTLLLIGPARRTEGRVTALVSIGLLLPAVVLLGWPYRLAPALIVAGLALTAVPLAAGWPRRLGSALSAAGVVLLVQSVAMFGYEAVTARWQDLPAPLPQLLGRIAQLMGSDVAVDGATLAMFSMREVHRVAATWGLLLDPLSLCFLVGGVAWIFLARVGQAPSDCCPCERRDVRAAVLFTIAMIVWLPLRAGLMTAIYMHRVLRTDYDAPLDLASQFWGPWMHLLLLAAPLLLAWRFARADTPGDEPPPPPAPRRGWKACIAPVLAFAAVGMLTVAIFWDPVGQRKGGRVLVDDYHSRLDWPSKDFDTTRTDKPFDTTWYGHASGYNYASIYDYCSRFYEMGRVTEPIDDQTLKNCDVLVLKDPSGFRRADEPGRPAPPAGYTPAEIAAIQRFVKRGGGVLLIGEHTSVYGSGVYLNELAEPFGFRFRYDCLFGIESVFDQRYNPPPHVPHPIVQHMPPMEFAISCSIDPGGSGGRAVIRATGLKDLSADYHASNFYPQAEDRPEMRYGAFVQLWATRHGQGRVAAFTDSTIFANFSAFEPGKTELMLGMLEWLNHRDDVNWARLPIAAAGLLLLIGALVASRFWHGGGVLMISAGVLGWVALAAGLGAVHKSAMPTPKAVRPMVRVAIDRTVCDTPLPKSGFVAGKDDQFGLFERSILRLGYFTFRSDAPDLFDSDLVVLMHPNQSVTPQFMRFRDRLVEYVHSGGKVLVLDSPQNTKSTANNLLKPFGVAVDGSADLSGPLRVPDGWPSTTVTGAARIRGGQPLARVGQHPVAAVARHGQGSVTVIGFATRFADGHMGVTGDVVPDEQLRNVYELEYALVRAIVADKLPSPK